MSDTFFDEETFVGIKVDPRVLWIAFTLLLVLFTSPLAHLPFLFGYGPLAAIITGFLAAVANVIISVFLAHWYRDRPPKIKKQKILEFDPDRKEN